MKYFKAFFEVITIILILFFFLAYPVSIAYYKLYKRSDVNSFEIIISEIFNKTNSILNSISILFDVNTIYDSLQVSLSIIAIAVSAPIYEKIKGKISGFDVYVKRNIILSGNKIISWKIFIRNNSSYIFDTRFDIYLGKNNWKDNYYISYSSMRDKYFECEIINNTIMIKNLVPKKWVILKFVSDYSNNIQIYKDKKLFHHKDLENSFAFGTHDLLLFRDYVIRSSRIRLSYILIYASLFLLLIIFRIFYLYFR